MKLYNTLTRKLEEFKPIKKSGVGIYSCGPTVYWNQHIGHMYAYIQWDTLVRALKYLGFQVKWVMNITDVGHLTSDEDAGEDKMEKGAKREGLTVWQIADKYLAQFLESMDLMNISRPDVLCRATEHIKEQVELIKLIEKNGFTYRTSTGLVFDTAKFSHYADFANLDLAQQQAGARVEVDPEKKNPWDFLLWVTNQPKHLMQWDSPWGRGFPGWHIECTAMSVKYLGKSFDIHTGGKEHIAVHHTNEIAQGYGAFGHQTANYWLHNEWLTFKGVKVSKSLGNFVLVTDLVEKGFDPLALRYLILTSHYRTGLDFSWESLKAADSALWRLRARVADFKKHMNEVNSGADVNLWQKKFKKSLEDDLGWPQALAVLNQMVDPKSGLGVGQKLTLAREWDQVLGLDLEKTLKAPEIPKEVQVLVEKRERLRKQGEWQKADEVRKQIRKLGWEVEDTDQGPVLKTSKDA